MPSIVIKQMTTHQESILQLIQQRPDPQNLHFEDTKIDDQAMEVIYQKAYTKILINISLSFNNITHHGLINFSNHQWKKLSYLNLEHNQIRDKGCKYISKASLPLLQTLYLVNNQIGRAGFLHLSKSQWRIIKTLQIQRNLFLDDGIHYFIKGNWNKQLADIVIQNDNKIALERFLSLVLINAPNLRGISLGYRYEKDDKNSILFLSGKFTYTNLT